VFLISNCRYRKQKLYICADLRGQLTRSGPSARELGVQLITPHNIERPWTDSLEQLEHRKIDTRLAHGICWVSIGQVHLHQLTIETAKHKLYGNGGSYMEQGWQ
jgi:hypothetical protein